MQADVGEVGGDVKRGIVSGEFVAAEGGVEFCENGMMAGVIQESSRNSKV